MRARIERLLVRYLRSLIREAEARENQRDHARLLRQARALRQPIAAAPLTPIEKYKARIGNRPLGPADKVPMLIEGLTTDISAPTAEQRRAWDDFETVAFGDSGCNSAYDRARSEILSNLRVEIVRKHIEGLGLEDICSSVTTAANPYFPPIAEPLRPSPDYVKAVLESWQEQQAERKPWMRQT